MIRGDLDRFPRRVLDDHDGYDGAFFALPGGGELELTAGPVEPAEGTEEDLLVLYVRTLDEVRSIGEGLVSAGVRTVAPTNPYWNRFGQKYLDPGRLPDRDRSRAAW